MMRLEASSERDFFAHLGAARDYWSSLYGERQLEIPHVIRKPNGGRGVQRVVMDEAEVWTLIDNELNPVYKSLWLMGAFGGIRISEQLNLWQCDVLPASARRHFFDFEDDATILVLRADPTESGYLGDTGRREVSRRRHLMDTYGMFPRPLYPTHHPLRAGWKGTRYSNTDFLVHPMYWINLQAAAMFAECAQEIRSFHRHHETSKRHPFYYANIADPTGEHRGQPTKMSNVQDAWIRACKRCHLFPHRWGRNIHGLRHFYKYVAAEIYGLSPDNIQVMMGHASVESQNAYGRALRETNRVLRASMDKRLLKRC
jgi:hypothetical protein